MTTDHTDWHQVLARVTGAFVRGEQRVTTQELLAEHLGVSVTDRNCRRLRRVMHDLGWHGPKLMRRGEETTRGYWRHSTVGLPAIPACAGMQEEPVLEIENREEGSLASELERLTGLALQKLDQILRIPTDRGDGNLLRAQTAAAGITVNAQLRADETRLRQKVRGDVLERLLKIIAEEKAKRELRRERALKQAKQVGGDVPAIGEPPDDAGEASCRIVATTRCGQR
jgi:hypothetical protein